MYALFFYCVINYKIKSCDNIVMVVNLSREGMGIRRERLHVVLLHARLETLFYISTLRYSSSERPPTFRNACADFTFPLSSICI